MFGGAESTKSFKGYLGEATFYRGHDVNSKTVSYCHYENTHMHNAEIFNAVKK